MTYRIGGHWGGRTIVREGVLPPDPDGRRPDDQLIAHVDSAAPVGWAERVCALLNADELGNPRGYHPTCIETTTWREQAAGERSFVCGPACPPPPADEHTEGHR